MDSTEAGFSALFNPSPFSFLFSSQVLPTPFCPGQVAHGAGYGSRCARNFTSRFRFCAVAAK